MTAASPRRQERGLRRMASILDAAEAVGAEVGFDAMTTNAVAARAGISPGSLYQFFANKAAIIAGLAQRYRDALAELGPLRIDPTVSADRARAADQVVEALIGFHLAHPGLRPILAIDPTSDLAPATAALHDELCEGVDDLIAGLVPARSMAGRQRAARVTIQIFAGVLPLVAEAPPSEQGPLTDELAAAIGAYWATL